MTYFKHSWWISESVTQWEEFQQISCCPPATSMPKAQSQNCGRVIKYAWKEKHPEEVAYRSVEEAFITSAAFRHFQMAECANSKDEFFLYRTNCIVPTMLSQLVISSFFPNEKKRTARMIILKEFPFSPGCHALVAMEVHRLQRGLFSWILCNLSSCSSGE